MWERSAAPRLRDDAAQLRSASPWSRAAAGCPGCCRISFLGFGCWGFGFIGIGVQEAPVFERRVESKYLTAVLVSNHPFFFQRGTAGLQPKSTTLRIEKWVRTKPPYCFQCGFKLTPLRFEQPFDPFREAFLSPLILRTLLFGSRRLKFEVALESSIFDHRVSKHVLRSRPQTLSHVKKGAPHRSSSGPVLRRGRSGGEQVSAGLVQRVPKHPRFSGPLLGLSRGIVVVSEGHEKSRIRPSWAASTPSPSTPCPHLVHPESKVPSTPTKKTSNKTQNTRTRTRKNKRHEQMKATTNKAGGWEGGKMDFQRQSSKFEL